MRACVCCTVIFVALEMSFRIPNNLLQVLADYTSQALGAAHDISDEFEEDINELDCQAKRICVILRIIRESAHRQSSAEGGNATLGGCESPKPIEVALRGLGHLIHEFTGLPDIGSAPMGREGQRRELTVQPLGKPVSLAEAALELFGHNTKIIFRRKDKRPRDAAIVEGKTERRGTVYSRLATSQRKRRFALYTARVALFPEAFHTPTLSQEGCQGEMRPFVSPAVREFADLNVEAEREMFGSFYRLDTKAELLREWPSLFSTVEHLQGLLRAEGVRFIPSEAMKRENLEGQLRWFEFPFTDNGVVRMIVKHVLAVDFTWELLQSGRWRVLGLHWLLKTRPPPAFLLPLGSGGCEDTSNLWKEKASSLRATTLRVEPAYYEAALRFLTNCFETGLEGGAVGALRLADAVTMEVIETQCRELKENFFVGPLEPSFVLDVRPGTHVSLALNWPHNSSFYSTTAPLNEEGGGPLYLKYKLRNGTVVFEKRRGTDTQAAVQSDFYTDCLTIDDGQSVVVVDIERQLWQFICA